MKRLFRIVLYLFSILFVSEASAQILNDTVSVYGARSTRYFYAKDFYDSVRVYHAIDTSFDRAHRCNFEYTKKGNFQDLGIMGTAIKPVYLQMPTELGYQTGFNSYDFYHFYPQDIKFYDTKSPYARINYIQGGQGEGMLDFDISRNINKKWNVGVKVRRVAARRNYGKTGNKLLDRVSDDYGIAMYTAYRTKNDRYGLLFTLSTLRHRVNETGGIIDTLTKPITKEDLNSSVKLGEVPVWFSTSDPNMMTVTFNDRNQYHLYQHFHIDNTNKLALYLETDYVDQYNRMNFNPLPKNTLESGGGSQSYFKTNNFSSILTNYSNNYKAFSNNLGLKVGSSFFDAKVYVKRRYVSYDEIHNQDYLSVDRMNFNDSYFGGEARLKYSENIFLKAYLEQQFDFSQSTRRFVEDSIGKRTYPDWSKNRDNKKFGVGVEYKKFSAGYSFIKYAPTIAQTYFISNNFIWNNDFTSPEASAFYAKWETLKSNYHLGFDMNYTDISNYIYFDADSAPTQAKAKINMLKTGLSAGLKLGNFHFDVNYIYSKDLANADLIRVPEHYVNPMVYYKRKILNKELDIAIGLDTRYATGYYADAYNPGTQQFYRQDIASGRALKVQDYYLVDLFLDMKFRKTGVFVKGVNLSQLWSNGNYFVTPYYAGMPMTFTFGINWEFYD